MAATAELSRVGKKDTEKQFREQRGNTHWLRTEREHTPTQNREGTNTGLEQTGNTH